MLLHALRMDGLDVDYMVGAQLAGYQDHGSLVQLGGMGRF